MSKGPNFVDSNGIATLEGKLRLFGGGTPTNDNNGESLTQIRNQGDFESALTATVCLKIQNYSFSGSKIESINFNQRLS